MMISIFAAKCIVIGASSLITFIYLLSWVKFQKYQFLERDYNVVAKHQEYSTKWHFFKGLNQIMFFAVMFLLVGPTVTSINVISYWIGFDGWFNKSVLNREFFYVGKTAKTDKVLQFISTKLSIPPNISSAIIKIGLLFGSLISYFN